MTKTPSEIIFEGMPSRVADNGPLMDDRQLTLAIRRIAKLLDEWEAARPHGDCWWCKGCVDCTGRKAKRQ